MRGTNVQNDSYQRCEHPGFPGASSMCNVLGLIHVPYEAPVYNGVRRGSGGGEIHEYYKSSNRAKLSLA
eukprot:6385586-Pyramimonas_sp.AAC.1